jgi:hypothetical protein
MDSRQRVNVHITKYYVYFLNELLFTENSSPYTNRHIVLYTQTDTNICTVRGANPRPLA